MILICKDREKNPRDKKQDLNRQYQYRHRNNLFDQYYFSLYFCVVNMREQRDLNHKTKKLTLTIKNETLWQQNFINAITAET